MHAILNLKKCSKFLLPSAFELPRKIDNCCSCSSENDVPTCLGAYMLFWFFSPPRLVLVVFTGLGDNVAVLRLLPIDLYTSTIYQLLHLCTKTQRRVISVPVSQELFIFRQDMNKYERKKY